MVAAIAQQNLQVAAGQIGQEPVPKGQQFQLTINTLGRLTDPEQFADIILKAGQRQPRRRQRRRPAARAGRIDGQAAAAGPSGTADRRHPCRQAAGIVRLRDVARVELGSQQYEQSCTLDGQPSVALNIFQLPGTTRWTRPTACTPR